MPATSYRKGKTLPGEKENGGHVSAHAHKDFCGSAPAPPHPRESHVGETSRRRETRPCHVTLHQLCPGMEPEEGTPLWRLQKLPPELGVQVRRARAAAAARAAGWPGELVDRVPPRRLSGLFREVGKREGTPSGRAPAFPGDAGRPRLGAPRWRLGLAQLP